MDWDRRGASFYYNRAVIYAMRGEKQKALDDLKKAKSLGQTIEERLIKQLQ